MLEHRIYIYIYIYNYIKHNYSLIHCKNILANNDQIFRSPYIKISSIIKRFLQVQDIVITFHVA